MPPSRDETSIDELKAVRDRELELKRRAGDIACAECRRQKVRCNRKVPCDPCIRKGCEDLCPTGRILSRLSIPFSDISFAEGTVKDGGAVKERHDERPGDTRKLVARIAALEDALRIQSGTASHPLLSSDLLRVKDKFVAAHDDCNGNEDSDVDVGFVSAFGTLLIGEGDTRYFGTSGADKVFLVELFGPAAFDLTDPEDVPRELVNASQMWPFVPSYISQPDCHAQLIRQLPSYERGNLLIENYFSHLSWTVTAPVDRSQIVEDVLPLFYQRGRPISPDLANPDKLHDLALLFSIFACGSLVDLTQPSVDPEAERFLHLARAALGIRSILHCASLTTCQALIVMSSYESCSGKSLSQECAQRLTSMALMIATSIGLHRDPSHWKLEDELANWRRGTFWELYTLDLWKSLGSGRPWGIPRETVDCELPFDYRATQNERGGTVESVWHWRYRFTRDVLSILVEKICSARPLRFSDVLDMDKLVRNFKVHPFVNSQNAGISTQDHIHPLISVFLKEFALVSVHRNNFARAMLEYPADPMRSPFSLSFYTAYRSSSTLLHLLYEASQAAPLLIDRLREPWANFLGLAVIVGSVAAGLPAGSFAESARKELEAVIALFESYTHHPVPQLGLKLLRRFREKATEARQPRDFQSTALMSTTDLERQTDQLTDEGLSILRGTTRYIERRNLSRSHEPPMTQPITWNGPPPQHDPLFTYDDYFNYSASVYLQDQQVRADLACHAAESSRHVDPTVSSSRFNVQCRLPTVGNPPSESGSSNDAQHLISNGTKAFVQPSAYGSFSNSLPAFTFPLDPMDTSGVATPKFPAVTGTPFDLDAICQNGDSSSSELWDSFMRLVASATPEDAMYNRWEDFLFAPGV